MKVWSFSPHQKVWPDKQASKQNRNQNHAPSNNKKEALIFLNISRMRSKNRTDSMPCSFKINENLSNSSPRLSSRNSTQGICQFFSHFLNLPHCTFQSFFTVRCESSDIVPLLFKLFLGLSPFPLQNNNDADDDNDDFSKILIK